MHGLFLEGAGWEDGKGEDEAALGSTYLWLGFRVFWVFFGVLGFRV